MALISDVQETVRIAPHPVQDPTGACNQMSPEHQSSSARSDQNDSADSAQANLQQCVLLVEDDRSARRYLEVTLQRAGYKVITAEDGLEGMRYALTSKVDVVLTDAVMPQMNGR